MKIIFWLEIQTLNNITRKVIASLNTKGEKARKEIRVTQKARKTSVKRTFG